MPRTTQHSSIRPQRDLCLMLTSQLVGYIQNFKNYMTEEAKLNSIISGGELGKAHATFDFVQRFCEDWRKYTELIHFQHLIRH